MTAGTDCFSINTETVAAEIVDGVAIVINLVTGAYYSMDHSAAMIWAQIERKQRVADIIAAMVRTYDVAPSRAQGDIERFLGELVHEQLIIPVAGDNMAAHASEESFAPDDRAQRPYEPPRLDIFTDLSPLIANDPPVVVRPLNGHKR